MPERAALAGVLAVLLAACVPGPSLAPSSAPSASAATPSPGASAPSSGTARPTASPEPPLSLALPAETDPRTVQVTVTPELPADGDGRLVVVVENRSEARIRELVLRWPTELDATLFLAPFAPSEQRIAAGGPPLLQDWSKWVVGPGEQGEPAGTTSLGWGPLEAGATLTIPVLVTRRAAGPVAFDLQLLAGEAILTDAAGEPAELRIELP